MKICSVLYRDFAHWDKWFPDAQQVVLHTVDDLALIEENDVVIFHGGTDLDPGMYYEQPGPYTQRPDRHRDMFEMLAYRISTTVGARLFGICRGAQLFTVMAGGSLIQHIEGHTGTGHGLNDRPFLTNSCHHQRMVPNEASTEIIDTAVEDGCPEVIYTKSDRAFGVQGHPEWLWSEDPFVLYVMALAVEKWES
jgi:gamma-glutamyl-gamma-aminobutyrate hydrolase PuuD